MPDIIRNNTSSIENLQKFPTPEDQNPQALYYIIYTRLDTCPSRKTWRFFGKSVGLCEFPLKTSIYLKNSDWVGFEWRHEVAVAKYCFGRGLISGIGKILIFRPGLWRFLLCLGCFTLFLIYRPPTNRQDCKRQTQPRPQGQYRAATDPEKFLSSAGFYQLRHPHAR